MVFSLLSIRCCCSSNSNSKSHKISNSNSNSNNTRRGVGTKHRKIGQSPWIKAFQLVCSRTDGIILPQIHVWIVEIDWEEEEEQSSSNSSNNFRNILYWVAVTIVPKYPLCNHIDVIFGIRFDLLVSNTIVFIHILSKSVEKKRRRRRNPIVVIITEILFLEGQSQ